ncbi:MAG: TonB-dependent receptor [Balneolaceae bacterium]
MKVVLSQWELTSYKKQIAFLAFFFLPVIIFAQSINEATISGQVIDSTSNEPIFGANVFITELSKGDATDADGNFSVRAVPAGVYQVRFSYLSYRTKTVEIEVDAGETSVVRVALVPDFVMGEDIQVMAQAAGQISAIKDQLQSNTIVNVVSAERISELPDQNAAESIGRLPGVSVQRNAGEAQKIVVRGLSPKFNSITVNGVRIPGTDANDRSVDLSLIPSDILSGIEVFKALTPDKDGDAVGGTVNLLVRRAPSGFKGDVRLQTGYNDLYNEFGQYKANFNISNRFLNNKLGVLLTGSIQRANRSSETLEADYTYRLETKNLEIENLNLADIIETRDRYGASLSMDYNLENGNLFFSSFWGSTDRDELRRRKRYRVGNGRVEYDLRDREINNQIYSNALRGEHDLDWLQIDWQAAHSYTLTRQPFSVYSRFQELTAYKDGLIDDQGPEPIPDFARNDLSRTFFLYGTYNPERGTDRDYVGEVNFKIPYKLFSSVDGFVKFGGKYRDKKRVQEKDERQTGFGVVSEIGQTNPDLYNLYNDTHIAMGNFIDPDFNKTGFLNGEYVFGPGLNYGKLNNFYETYQNQYQVNRFLELSDYIAGESISSAYLMTQIQIGSKLMILPGFRYELTETFYEGKAGNLTGNLGVNGELVDTTGGQTYGELLPMVHLKYQITDGIDIRFAVTRTLSRPDYFNLVPSEIINEAELTINRGNPDIKHTTVMNYDAFLSFYKNSIGYFSVGAFYKELKDIDYIKVGRIFDPESEFNGFRLTEPINGDESTVYGVEFDLQTDLRFLPNPLNGFILNTNLTYIHSETFFPLLLQGPRSTEPPYRATYIDTSRAGKLPGQPDMVASVSLGYEKGGFSGRLSFSYQKEILERVGAVPEEDIVDDSYGYWDLAINQKFKKIPDFTFFVNVNNLTNESEKTYAGSSNKLGRNEVFGITADTGIRYRF